MANGFTMNPDGTISYNQTGWDKLWNGTNTDAQAYALEFNAAQKQYQEQLALQKEAQSANLQNMAFNQNLANRQQSLSEESYYNGVLNEASQLSKLGINPASSQGGISGATMSGGSNVSGVPSGSASGRNPGSHNFQAKAMQQLQMLTFLTGLAKQRSDITLQDAQAKAVSKQADVAQQNADTNALNAESNRRTSVSTANLNQARTEAQRIENARNKGDMSYLESIGLTSKEWDTLSGLSFTSSQASKISAGLGIVGLGNVLGSSADSSTSSTISGSTLFVLLSNSTSGGFTMRDFVTALNLSGETVSTGAIPAGYQRVLNRLGEEVPDYSGHMATVNMLINKAIENNWSNATLWSEFKQYFNIE